MNFEKVPEDGKDYNGPLVRSGSTWSDLRALRQAHPADLPKTWSRPHRREIQGQARHDRPVVHRARPDRGRQRCSKNLGWDYYEKLRKNDIMIVQGNQQVSDMIKRGERLIAVGALDSYAADDRKAGHPIVTILPADGAFVIPSPTAIVKGSPNPNAAKALRRVHDRATPHNRSFPEMVLRRPQRHSAARGRRDARQGPDHSDRLRLCREEVLPHRRSTTRSSNSSEMHFGRRRMSPLRASGKPGTDEMAPRRG